MTNSKILWVDDEVDLLQAHILFLTNKGYEVTTATNGTDAIGMVSEAAFDVVFLDENMPGISGLEALTEMKQIHPNLPIVMITKSEEEYIMEEAIGSKIADYLIKPVNPNQILLTLKKILDNSRLVTEKTTSSYQQEFRKIAMDFFHLARNAANRPRNMVCQGKSIIDFCRSMFLGLPLFHIMLIRKNECVKE